jgi:hypothetical protein
LSCGVATLVTAASNPFLIGERFLYIFCAQPKFRIISEYESLHKFEGLYSRKQNDSEWTEKLALENEIYTNQQEKAYSNIKREMWMIKFDKSIKIELFGLVF